MKLREKLLIALAILFAILIVVFIYLDLNLEETHPLKDYAAIVQKKELNVVTDYNPIGYFVSDDTIAGFNYELLQYLQEYIPVKINISLESSLNKSLEGLKVEKYDIVARNIPVTSELRNEIIFTEVIAQNRQVLIQRKEAYNNNIAPIRSHLQLAGETLHVAANSPSILRIKNLAQEIGDSIHYKEDEIYSPEQLILQVAAGELNYVVCDEKIAKKIAESTPEIDCETFISFTHLEAWAVRNDTPVLLDSLNTWIKQIKKTKRYKEIYKKYYE